MSGELDTLRGCAMSFSLGIAQNWVGALRDASRATPYPTSKDRRNKSMAHKAENTQVCQDVWLCELCTIWPRRGRLKPNHHEPKRWLGDTAT